MRKRAKEKKPQFIKLKTLSALKGEEIGVTRKRKT
jgi:hypothetical protein